MLDAVYFDTMQSKSIVAARPKPPLKPIFQVAAGEEGSGMRIVNEPFLGSSVFGMEAGESRTPPETRCVADWLDSQLETATHEPDCKQESHPPAPYPRANGPPCLGSSACLESRGF